MNLTRELGVNLAGIEVILNMRHKMREMERQMEQFMEFVRGEFAAGLSNRRHSPSRGALVRVSPPKVIRVEK